MNVCFFRIFAVDNQNIEALHFTVLNLMCRETNYDEVCFILAWMRYFSSDA